MKFLFQNIEFVVRIALFWFKLHFVVQMKWLILLMGIWYHHNGIDFQCDKHAIGQNQWMWFFFLLFFENETYNWVKSSKYSCSWCWEMLKWFAKIEISREMWKMEDIKIFIIEYSSNNSKPDKPIFSDRFDGNANEKFEKKKMRSAQYFVVVVSLSEHLSPTYV